MRGSGKITAANWLAWTVGILLVATVGWLGVQVARRPHTIAPKVIVGTRDEVYYSHGATMQEATELGHALQGTGFFNDRGTSVQLSRINGLATIWFVLNESAWDHPDTVASFEEIGRRVATAVGGFPIQVRLVDSAWTVRKSLVVGKAMAGAKDAIYYYGAATAADAKALGQALRQAGYLQDLGVAVVVSKDAGTVLSFVVGKGVWERPEAVASFARLARMVAPSVGGLPVQLRLLSPEMEAKKEVTVR